MRKIIVYTSKKSSSLADVLSGIEEVNVRIEDASKLRDYETLNAALLVIEDVPDIINKTSILREKGRSIYVGTNLEIRKDKPFKIYFEVYEPRQGSWLIYLNKDNGIKY